MNRFGSSKFYQEIDLWFYWIVGQLTLSALSIGIRRSTCDGIDRSSAPIPRFEICCLNSTVVAGFEMWSDDAGRLL